MKKAVSAELIKRVCLTASSFILVLALLGFSANAWFIHNSHLDADASPIYAVNQGHSGDLLDSKLQRIYPENDKATEVTMIPGDLVYYTFVFQIPEADLGKTDYSVKLDMTPGVYGKGEEGVDGEYLLFLHNCVIQENACSLSVMRRGVDKTGSITRDYYDPVSYVYENNAYRMKTETDPDTTATTTMFSATTPDAAFLNTEVASFCPDSDEESVGATFQVTFPQLSEYPTDTETTDPDGKCVYFMFYVPIWYRDTGENQNTEMYSQLKINGCTLTLIETETE